jgi:hypothetical protein
MLKVCKILYLGVAFAMLLVGSVAAWRQLRRPATHFETCISLLKQIEGAKSTWALEHSKRADDVPTWSDLVGETKYIRTKPICHRGGTYTIGAVGEIPRCTVPDHVLP